MVFFLETFAVDMFLGTIVFAKFWSFAKFARMKESRLPEIPPALFSLLIIFCEWLKFRGPVAIAWLTVQE